MQLNRALAVVVLGLLASCNATWLGGGSGEAAQLHAEMGGGSGTQTPDAYGYWAPFARKFVGAAEMDFEARAVGGILTVPVVVIEGGQVRAIDRDNGIDIAAPWPALGGGQVTIPALFASVVPQADLVVDPVTGVATAPRLGLRFEDLD